MRNFKCVPCGSGECIVDPNKAEEELRDDISDWLNEISDPASFGNVREISAIHVYDSVAEYFRKFREEFFTESPFTIREMEVVFFEELESCLQELHERVCELKDTAEDVLEEIESNGPNLDSYLESEHCDDVDDLSLLSESDCDEAHYICKTIEEVHDELNELKEGNEQTKRLIMYVPIEEKTDSCCDN